MRRLRALSEAECYARCHGVSEATIRVIKLVPRRARPSTPSGEALRIRFEELLDSRDPAAAVEAA